MEKIMQKYLKVLEKCPLFEGISGEDLPKMLTCFDAKVISFDKKYTVLAEGSRGGYIGIVLSGSVQISRNDFYGNRSIITGAQEGELFGEAFACAQTELTVTVTAAEPSTVMLIKGDHLLYTCSNHCGFHQRLIFNLMKELAEKNIQLHQSIEILSKRSTAEKLTAYLDLQAKRSKSRSFDIPFDRQELADYLQVDRSGLSVQIGRLVKQGIIKCRKNHFELL